MKMRPIGLVVLSTHHWPTLLSAAELILRAVNDLAPEVTPMSNAADAKDNAELMIAKDGGHCPPYGISGVRRWLHEWPAFIRS
jgi:hypothetical protein